MFSVLFIFINKGNIMRVYTENVFSTLMKMLGGGKVRKELRKIEKITQDDPELQQQLKDLAATYKRVKATMKKFCERNPGHNLCKKGYGGKSKITDIKY